jgi:hypothetical protein
MGVSFESLEKFLEGSWESLDKLLEGSWESLVDSCEKPVFWEHSKKRSWSISTGLRVVIVVLFGIVVFL